MPTTTINDKTYTPAILAGRCANGNERGGGSVVHWVECDRVNTWATRAPALCGKSYTGRSAGFSARQELEITCPRCIKKMAKLMEEQASRIKAEQDVANYQDNGETWAGSWENQSIDRFPD